MSRYNCKYCNKSIPKTDPQNFQYAPYCEECWLKINDRSSGNMNLPQTYYNIKKLSEES